MLTPAHTLYSSLCHKVYVGLEKLSWTVVGLRVLDSETDISRRFW